MIFFPKIPEDTKKLSSETFCLFLDVPSGSGGRYLQLQNKRERRSLGVPVRHPELLPEGRRDWSWVGTDGRLVKTGPL